MESEVVDSAADKFCYFFIGFDSWDDDRTILFSNRTKRGSVRISVKNVQSRP